MSTIPREPSRRSRGDMPPSFARSGSRFRIGFVALGVAIGLTWLFWGPLWEGGSLIGGDLFPYFFPQKVYLAEQLPSGTLPMWNPLTGHGYPTISESQTGVCYPPNLLAYRFLSVTTAYNALQISHYVLAFLGMFYLARRWDCSLAGGLLAGLSFVYGWFPPRICLEWAILTGAYLPWVFWCAEGYLREGRRNYLIGVSLLLALQILAGHFHLAFLTQLALALYAPLRIAVVHGSSSITRGLAQTIGLWFKRRGASVNTLLPQETTHWLALWGAMAFAFFLAAVQILPTWELKQRSQRSEISEEHQPGYGHLPPQYWSQTILPWIWYTGPIDASLAKLPNYAGGAGTNQVEAHLYFGLFPLVLAIGGLITSWTNPSEADRTLRLWFFLGLGFLVYTPGWLLPMTQYLPGFNFFRGPGRYGIITSLAVALLAGVAFSRFLRRLSQPWRFLVALLVLGETTAELWWVAQRVGYSEMLATPIVERRGESSLRRVLASEPQPVRLFAPMANVANLMDVSSTPIYLGIGPREYFDRRYTMPDGGGGGLDPRGDPAQLEWLRQAGVTHILSLVPLLSTTMPVEWIWSGGDPVLSIAFGRSRQEPFYLYRLRTATGRAVWEGEVAEGTTVEVAAYHPHRVELHCKSPVGGRVLLRDLAYPGWRVTVDGRPRETEVSGMFRAVSVEPGEHRIVWTYRPASVYCGALITGASVVVLIVWGVWRRTVGHNFRLSSRQGKIS